MTILERRQDDGGQVATGGGSSWTDVFWSARQKAVDIDNFRARESMLEEEHDKRLTAIFQATGQRRDNPMLLPSRETYDGDLDDDAAVPRSRAEHIADFNGWLRDLAKNHPEHAAVIQPDLPPTEMALKRRNASELAQHQVMARYQGPFGTGALADIAGGVVGSFDDPVNAAANLAGPMGRVGLGLKALLWSAAKQGAANAGVEVAMQPRIAAWRNEASALTPALGYDAGDFARNVGLAFVTGAGLDLGVRGVSRGVQNLRGREAVLDAQGGVERWTTPEDALEQAALRSKSDLLRQAAAGDAKALRQLAEDTGTIHDPKTRAALEMLDDREATNTRLPGVDADEHAQAELQAARHLGNPMEPMPVLPEPLRPALGPSLGDGVAPATVRGAALEIDGLPAWRERMADAPDGTEGHALVFEHADGTRETLAGAGAGDAWVLREADGWTRAQAETQAARKQLHEGRLDPVEAALLMREHPDALDARLSLRGAEMRQARSLARLDERAFDMVADGQAKPHWGALVADLVADPAQHASILRELNSIDPGSERTARQVIGALTRRPDDGRPPYRGGMDDPGGAEGDLQIARLEKMLADEIGAIEGKPRSPDAPPLTLAERMAAEAFKDAPEASLAHALDDVAALERMAQVAELCKL